MSSGLLLEQQHSWGLRHDDTDHSRNQSSLGLGLVLRFGRLVWCESVAVLDGLARRRREDVCESTDAHREERWHRVRGEDPSRLVFSFLFLTRTNSKKRRRLNER